ncbi:MAG TPA: hypothetical protein ENI65_02290 [Gammaproteobacteria bacterium]|nr:hypothetical protein [Gammaproteobacteria bacterium]
MTDTTDRARSPLYKVALVEKTQSLEGSEKQGWHRYVLENGRSTIVGQRCGSLKDVTAYATQYTEELNARSTMARSTWSPRGRKPV